MSRGGMRTCQFSNPQLIEVASPVIAYFCQPPTFDTAASLQLQRPFRLKRICTLDIVHLAFSKMPAACAANKLGFASGLTLRFIAADCAEGQHWRVPRHPLGPAPSWNLQPSRQP